MLGSSALGKVAPFVSVVGSAYGFCKTCIKVYRYKTSSPSGAIVGRGKGIVAYKKNFYYLFFKYDRYYENTINKIVYDFICHGTKT